MQGLKALVIFLGVLILIAAGVVAVTIYKRATGKIEATQSAAPSSRPAFGKQNIALPEGAHLDDFAASGDRLILKLRLADGSPRILVFDLDSGAELGEFDFAPAP
ncbi:MAG TPA: hypothetical protein VI732_03655 [Alphaproteobacteria bacterium]|jgi:hypothetical protein|nr:hypothetical protein [Alphaproteobacteria bacterium]